MYLMRHPLSQTEGTALMGSFGVFGIGSPFGADVIAWQVVALLPGILPENMSNRLSYRNLDRPGVRLLDHLQHCSAAIILDAVQLDLEPACVLPVREEDFAAESSAFSSHNFGLGETLVLGRCLGELPSLLVLGISVGKDPNHVPLEKEVQRAAHGVARHCEIFFQEQMRQQQERVRA